MKDLITHEDLISLGFTHNPGPILNNYYISISHFGEEANYFKQLSVNLDIGNTYVYLREQDNDIPESRLGDSLICIFNQDINGVLTKDWIETLLKLLLIKK